MGGKITFFRAVVVFVMIVAVGLVFAGVPWILAGILAIVVILVTWVMKTAVAENTGDPEKDLFELGVRHTGAIKGRPLTGSEERIRMGESLELSLNGVAFTLGIASLRSGAAYSGHGGRAVFLGCALGPIAGLTGRIGRRTFLRFLDRFAGADCRYANAVTVKAGTMPLLVSGKDRDLLADLLANDTTLQERVSGLIEAGYDEIHFSEGAINLWKIYERGDTSLERLEAVLRLAGDVAWVLDTEENAGRVLAPPPETIGPRPSSLFIYLILAIALATGIAMTFFSSAPSDLLLISVTGGAAAAVVIILRVLGILR